MDYEYSDAMEFEYTNPQPFFDAKFYKKPETSYTPPPKGTFQVPESFFAPKYTRTSYVTNTVCNLLNSFSLDDDPPKQETTVEEMVLGAQSQPVEEPLPQQEKQAVVLFSPPISPQREAEELPISTKSPQLQANIIPSPSVDQNDIPTTTTTSSLPPYTSLSPPPQSTVYNNSYTPTPTIHYYYQQAQPVDPLSHSHGTIHYITGIFKILVATILLVAALYLSSHVVLNFHQDMKTKIERYESDFLSDQMYCQQQYDVNRCTPDTRLPAIADLCRDWERCLLRPLAISKSQVLAETLADMANGFSNTVTLKTMFLSLGLGLIIIWATTRILMGYPSTITPQPKQLPQLQQPAAIEDKKKLIEPMRFEALPL